MRFENRKWVILTLDDYSNSELQTLVDNALENSIDTLRKSVDGTKTCLLYTSPSPRD